MQGDEVRDTSYNFTGGGVIPLSLNAI